MEKILGLDLGSRTCGIAMSDATKVAQDRLIFADVSRKKRKQVIDKMAAVAILQGYLDAN